MQYLVLQRFHSFGTMLMKGTVVDESTIRSPRLRQSEGKIIPAVSSLKVPVEVVTEGAPLQDTLKGQNKKSLKGPKISLKN